MMISTQYDYLQNTLLHSQFYLVVLLFIFTGCKDRDYSVVDEINNAQTIISGSNLSLDSSGNIVAFTRFDSVSTIYTCSSSGQYQKRITTGEKPSVSLNGNYIAFIRSQYISNENIYRDSLFLIDINSLQEICLRPETLNVRINEIVWSPDGSKLALNTGPRQWVILEIDRQIILNNIEASTFSWSPTSTQFVYSNDISNGIFIGTVGEQTVIQVNSEWYAENPVWLSNQNTIAYWNGFENTLMYFRIDSRSDSIVSPRMFKENGLYQKIAISLDGKNISRKTEDMGNADYGSSSEITVANITKPGTVKIVFLYYTNIESMRWSTDSKYLFFVGRKYSNSVIYKYYIH